jgi:uncharacterized protein DUF6160
MKKLGFLTAAIWVISLMIMPQNGFAKMTVMSDNQLRQITGQAGIAIQPGNFIGLNLDAERLARNDGDGDDFGDAFALNNVMPEITFSDPTALDQKFATEIIGDSEDAIGINMTIQDMDVYIDEMTSDLRLGSGDSSSSLGIVSIQGFHAHISGNVRIYIRE